MSDSNTNQTATLVVGGAIIVIAIITVGLRFYTRISTKLGLWWDDWLIFLAGLTTLVTAILLLVSNAIDPNGDAASTTTDPNFVYTPEDTMYIKLAFFSGLLYFTIAGSTKLGILLMYFRIFKVDRNFRRQLWVASILVVSWWLSCTIATLLNCIPLEWGWINALDDPRYCFNFNIFWMASGVCEIIIDVIVLTLPIRAIIRLQLSPRKKATVACIFLLGGFVIITGLLKVILGYVPGAREPNYDNTEIWTVVHTGMAIICGDLPVFKPLVTRIANWTLLSKLSNFTSGIYQRSQGGARWSVMRSKQRNRGLSSSRRLDDGDDIEECGSDTELRGMSPAHYRVEIYGPDGPDSIQNDRRSWI